MLLLCSINEPDAPPHHDQAEASTKELVGYQEGSKRWVKCRGGGYFTGVDASFRDFSMFTEKVVTGVRLRCST